MRKGEFGQAQREIETARKQGPQDRGVQQVLADLDLATGHPELAEHRMHALAVDAPCDPVGHLGLAAVSASRGPGYLFDRWLSCSSTAGT